MSADYSSYLNYELERRGQWLDNLFDSAVNFLKKLKHLHKKGLVHVDCYVISKGITTDIKLSKRKTRNEEELIWEIFHFIKKISEEMELALTEKDFHKFINAIGNPEKNRRFRRLRRIRTLSEAVYMVKELSNRMMRHVNLMKKSAENKNLKETEKAILKLIGKEGMLELPELKMAKVIDERVAKTHPKNLNEFYFSLYKILDDSRKEIKKYYKEFKDKGDFEKVGELAKKLGTNYKMVIR